MNDFSIKTKLLIIFVLMKVIPLLILGWLAWYQVVQLVGELDGQSAEALIATRGTVEQAGEVAVKDSIRALDVKSRENIEHLTTDTAKAVADFLYDRDRDIRMLAQLPPDAAIYRTLLTNLTRPVTEHGEWKLDSNGQQWIPVDTAPLAMPEVQTQVEDNRQDWHYRLPEVRGFQISQPLYLEITFVDREGNEQIKVTTPGLLPETLRNVADKANTWCRAESYFSQLSKLKPGEIYVSDVIGPYVGSPIVGMYTPQAAREMGIEFRPETAAYAGKENPVGVRFRGLIRWATPVVVDGAVQGYVTMALDHRHLAEFTNHIVPTEERYSSIPDASSGNYAFLWDNKGRSVVHPRHHSIVGYDPTTGEPAVPWMEESLYRQWKSSGLPLSRFLASTPEFFEPSQEKRPAQELTRAGFVGLDGRFLNFAPQCLGWHELTQHGGSGSFLIYWSGLWKLTTAAAIPYYTGQYENSPRGFGYVTIGANVEEFHRAANDAADHIQWISEQYLGSLDERQRSNRQAIFRTMERAVRNLTLSTLLMSLLAIMVAIGLATFLTRRIRDVISGIRFFQTGNFDARLRITANDEMGDLGRAFNSMAEGLQTSIEQLREARDRTDALNRTLEQAVAERTRDLYETNHQLLLEIEERTRAEAVILNLAYYDYLTGLPNRALLREKILKELVRVKNEAAIFAVIFLDLDGFKAINDNHGHEAGDTVLREVAKRLQAVVESQDLVCRLGGDEFVVLIANVAGEEEAQRWVRRLLDALRPVIAIGGQEFAIGASSGISLCPRDGEDMDLLLKKADAAMYCVKKKSPGDSVG